jgi:hypothetical protein
MSTSAVQPEIDALTALQEAGVILGFEFRGQPSPCFEVDLVLSWAEAPGGSTEALEREAALDKAMNALDWHFDDFIALPDNDGVERWIYRFRGEAKSVIPGGHYRCVDASGQDGGAWDIQADSPKEAAQAFVDDDGDFEPRSQTVWIHVRVESPDGDEGTYKVEIKPVAPPCTNPGGHLWLDPRYWGSGAGVLVEETCDHCGRTKRINTGSHDPVDGSPATVVSYEMKAEAEAD